MKRSVQQRRRRATVLLMIVGLLAMLFMLVTAFIMLARFDRQTLQMTGRADRVTHIVDAINDVAAAAIRGARGGDLVSGAAYVDIPGSGNPNDPNWGSPWLASAEPVRNPIGGYDPIDYSYPAVSGLSGALDPIDANVPLTRLMLDANADGTMNIQPGDASNPSSLPLDTLANARQPFSDADGDGMPDSLFGSVGVLTELANAMGGRSVHAGGVNTANLNPNDPHPDVQANYLAWQQYDSTARYAVAAKIVSHGGMVQVSAPTNALQWNSAFTGAMFNWIEHFLDVPIGGTLAPAVSPTDRYQLQAMFAQRGAVEPVLRRRGGLLAGSRGTVQDGLPPALWALQSRFPRTFAPPYWQRFNLASLDDWDAWRSAATIDLTLYDEGYTEAARANYAARQVLTTVNNSDELARIEDPNDAVGLPRGALKFYLGRITDTTADPGDPYPRGAFLPDGTFNGQYPPNNPRGPAIVRELASYFNEMLSGYDGWATGGTEAVPLREQAFMLAVNTVAFAAPRVTVNLPPGIIDNVWYLDDADGHNDMYVGYAPQPFITQVMAYRKRDDPEDPNSTKIALAIELYNPNDRAPDTDPCDPSYALRLEYFAISLDDQYEGNGFAPTFLGVLNEDAGQPFPAGMRGRTFLPLILSQTGNQYFEHSRSFDPNSPLSDTTPLINSLDVSPSATGTMTVKLWRRGLSAPLGVSPDQWWVLVDQFEFPTPADAGPNDPNWPGSVVDAWRDTNYETYWGPDSLGQQARWRCAIAFPHPPGPNDPNNVTSEANAQPHDCPTGSSLSLLGEFTGAGPGLGPTSPCVPLYTMNANRVSTFVHGVARPASFPTVGFMSFVPRFSHTGKWTSLTDPPNWVAPLRPATSVLYEQWHKHASYSVAGYPADFGHMPIFDNTQAVNAGPTNPSDFVDTKTGRVPWGLLVFDYFTTLNPNDPTVDPYRVPGRINVNDASWYVLAGLPLIGPLNPLDPKHSNLPVDQSASPAFWSVRSGILTGKDSAENARLPWFEQVGGPLVYDGWWRLGPYLAQAAAAYRDRVPYVALGTPLYQAFDRNDGNVYRPVSPYGPIRRGTAGSVTDPPGKRGFLTIAELANVMGFDSLVLNSTVPFKNSDFMQAASLLALLDTHFLTTRSNTFTVYTTLFDREDPQASASSQVTLDRSNLLPRLVPTGINSFTTLQSDGPPELIARRDYSYFNAQYDQ